jgi:hypothetical protein
MIDHFKKKSMGFILLMLLCAAAAIGLFNIKPFGQGLETDGPDRMDTIDMRQAPGQVDVHLYVVDKENSFLTAKKRRLDTSEDPARFAADIVRALLDNLLSARTQAVSEKSPLNAVYVGGDGTAYVDLAENIFEAQGMGCQTELLTVYAMVNSLILNMSKIERVKFLVGGKEAATLAGHIDLHRFYDADMLLIR